jgi:sugar phosphate isomerase/epimerase
LAHLIQCIETSAELGARLIGGSLYAPIGYLPGRRRTLEEWNWAIECFQKLGEVLDANQITLSIEPVNRSETFFNDCRRREGLLRISKKRTLPAPSGHLEVASNTCTSARMTGGYSVPGM